MKKLAKILEKRLNDWGFQTHIRHCHQASDYGQVEDGVFVPDDEVVEECWNNKDFINWLLNADEKEMSESADELKKYEKE